MSVFYSCIGPQLTEHEKKLNRLRAVVNREKKKHAKDSHDYTQCQKIYQEMSPFKCIVEDEFVNNPYLAVLFEQVDMRSDLYPIKIKLIENGIIFYPKKKDKNKKQTKESVKVPLLEKE